MSDVTAAAPERIRFEDMKLQHVLQGTEGALASYTPDDATELHRRVMEGNNAPINLLLRQEAFIVPVDPSKKVLRDKVHATDQKIARLAQTREFVKGQTAIDPLDARYLIQDGYTDIQTFVETMLGVKRWRPERIDQAKQTMTGELLSSPAGWGWWLISLTDYEMSKKLYIQRRL